MSAAPSEVAGEANDGGRPAKRRRVGVNHRYRDHLRAQILLEELNVEIALRERLSNTVNSRLTWALMLQDRLARESQAQAEEGYFAKAALDALDAIEEPCDIIHDRETRLPLKALAFPASVRTSPSPEPAPVALQGPRPSSLRIRGIPRAPPPPAKKLLFLRNYNTSPPEVAKLACPDCSRSDFTNLQGLLNHCRIRHHREFGSHDECIQRCTFLVSGEERDWVAMNGTELGGISLPSLRRLFEIAVGQEKAGGIFDAKRDVSGTPDAPDSASQAAQDPADSVSTHVTRTLGHHANSPALALFLGRAPQKREIHVYQEEVDIDSVTEAFETKGRCFWRRSHADRNAAREELDAVTPLINNEESHEDAVKSSDEVLGESLAILPNALASRFYIRARIKVLDESLWLRLDRRLNGLLDHTHKWRLSVSSPSYSLHISSILSHFTVTCLSDPPPSTLREPVLVTEPPFVVTGTSDRPFLVKLTLTWAGTANSPTEIVHWVELDPSQADSVVKGEEQLFDVDLDRDTEFLPLRESQTVPWDVHRSRGPDDRRRPTGDSIQWSDEPDHITKLRSLLALAPMTLRDIKSRAIPCVSYMLPTTVSRLRSMVVGRRKAIELGRARTLRSLYEDFRSSHPELVYPELTTSDVYHWMADEDLFSRRSVLKELLDHSPSHAVVNDQDASSAPSETGTYCRDCGLHSSLHQVNSVVKTEQLSTALDPMPVDALSETYSCSALSLAEPRIPIFDVHGVLSACKTRYGHPGICPMLFQPGDRSAISTSLLSHSLSASSLLGCANPQQALAIRALVRSSKADCFSAIADDRAVSPDTHPLLERSRAEIEQIMGPYALLTLLTQSFAKLLLRAGLKDFNDYERNLQDGGQRQHSTSEDQNRPHRLLVPAHILRGLSCGAQQSLVEAAALVVLGRLGNSSAFGGPSSAVVAPVAPRSPISEDRPTSTASDSPGDRVKMEVDE